MCQNEHAREREEKRQGQKIGGKEKTTRK